MGVRWACRVTVVAVLAAVASGVGFAAAGTARAAPAGFYPNETTSLYEYGTDQGTLYNQGCDRGRQTQQGVVILDFGRPAYQSSGALYGTIDFAGNFDWNGHIAAAAEAFARGYAVCAPASSPAHVAVALGTSNSCSAQDPSCHGSDQPPGFTQTGHWWGVWTGRVHDYLAAQGLTARVRSSAGDDAEPAWDPAYTNTRDFVDGFSATVGQAYPMWDYGSLDPGYWSDAEMYHVAYGDPPNVPFGEIYYSSQAAQWENLDLWAVSQTGRAMEIFGVMSEYPYAGYRPHDAYNAMLRALQGHASTYQKAIDYLTNI